MRRKCRRVQLYEEPDSKAQHGQHERLLTNITCKEFDKAMVFQATKPRLESDKKFEIEFRQRENARHNEIEKSCACSDPYSLRKNKKNQYSDSFCNERGRGTNTTAYEDETSGTDDDEPQFYCRSIYKHSDI